MYLYSSCCIIREEMEVQYALNDILSSSLESRSESKLPRLQLLLTPPRWRFSNRRKISFNGSRYGTGILQQNHYCSQSSQSSMSSVAMAAASMSLVCGKQRPQDSSFHTSISSSSSSSSSSISACLVQSKRQIHHHLVQTQKTELGSLRAAQTMAASQRHGQMVAGSQRHGSCWDSRRKATTIVMAGQISQSSETTNVKAAETKNKSNPSISSLADIYEFICSGPLLAKTGYTKESVAETIDEWLALGVKLSRQLRFNEFALSMSEKVRVYHYYVPVFLWCKRELELHTSKYGEGADSVPPLVIGISAPQGCGKTTIVYSLEYLFNSFGSRAAAISIDDFYLTAAGQAELAASNCNNGLLKLRGNAGSHDLQLGTDTLKALRSLTSSGMKAKVPRYDKSANAGFGDRADPSKWSEVEGPLKVVLFEGWMLGFEPEDEAAVTAVDPQLVAVNKNLVAYHDAWHKMIDSWVIIQVRDPVWVYTWRQQAEAAMRADGRSGMTDEQVADFVSIYMPAYNAYLPALYKKGPRGASHEHMLRLQIDEDRNPIG